MFNGGIHVCQKIYWLHFLLILQKNLMISVCMLWLKNKLLYPREYDLCSMHGLQG